jgi:hypothetical protein
VEAALIIMVLMRLLYSSEALIPFVEELRDIVLDSSGIVRQLLKHHPIISPLGWINKLLVNESTDLIPVDKTANLTEKLCFIGSGIFEGCLHSVAMIGILLIPGCLGVSNQEIIFGVDRQAIIPAIKGQAL